jgi:hypothetical protein
MAIHKDRPIKPNDEIILAEAIVDTIGGTTKSEIVLWLPYPEAWLEEMKEDGWTLTRYRRVEEDAA